MSTRKLAAAMLFGGFVVLMVIGGVRRTEAQLARLLEMGAGDEAAEHEDDHDGPETAVSGWQTVRATVTDVRPNGLWLQLESGEALRVRRQPWLFATAQGFEARSGDAMRVQGYGEGSQFEVAVLENLVSGQRLRLRDENGRSLWSQHPHEE